MMTNKQKIKGSNWEREAAKKLSSYAGEWTRVPGSGAIGTLLGEPRLSGDIIGKTRKFFNKDFKLEAKTGYGGAKQLTVQKEWLDKVAEEAEKSFAFPGLVAKFSGARSGVRQFIIFDIDVFGEILRYVESLSDELDKVYEELAEKENE